jgi:FtsP/CotA-like multicopper oxidase with cupredoxin domain
MPQQGYTMPLRPIDRRTLLRAAAIAGGSAATIGWFPAWAQPVSTGTTAAMPELAGEDIALRIGRQAAIVDGRSTSAIGINGTVPAPLLRLREGQRVRLHVTNDLDEDTRSTGMACWCRHRWMACRAYPFPA